MRDRIRVQNQVETLLEDARMAALGDERWKCTRQQLAEALEGSMTPIHQRILEQHLKHVQLLEEQIEELDKLAATSMREQEAAIARLVEIPGIRLLSAQQIIAEAGPSAQTFATAAQFSAWIGVCPGREESAGDNHNSRCPKGNIYLRRTLCQAAQAAVRTKNSFFQQKFQRLLPRLGYQKALWAIARRISVVIWIILHEGARYKERGGATTPQAAKRRHQRIIKELRAAGYTVQLQNSKPEVVRE